MRLDEAQPRRDLRPAAVWFVGVVLLGSLSNPSSGLVGIPVDFLLKDGLGLGPQAIARAHAWFAVPGYAALLFGYLRDRRFPFGIGDRGLLLLWTVVSTVALLLLAFGEQDYARLVLLLLVARIAIAFCDPAWGATAVDFGRRYGVTDRISAINNTAGTLVGAATAALGGWIVGRASLSGVLVGVAVASALFFGLVARPPADVFVDGGKRGAPEPVAREEIARLGNPAKAFAELARHPAVRVVVGLTVLGVFAPAYGTPAFFFLTDRVGLTPEQYGLYTAVQGLAMVPAAAAYGVYGRRWPLRRTLFASLVIGFLQPLLFFAIHGPTGAVAIAALFGLSGGLYNVAIYDLYLRALPERLAGTGLALITTMAVVSGQLSELAGAALYERGGFALSVWLGLPTVALMFPLLRWLPASIDERGATE